jgi:uncharacterized membrane protein YdbT with pleckstrin-like domain
MPKNYIDRMLGEHERILLTAHQHWLILLDSVLVEIVLFVIILAIGFGAQFVFPAQTLQNLPIQPWVIAIILALFPVLSSVRDILYWHNREYIITNRRVIQISGVINKDVIDSSLDKVNDVKMDQSALGRLFDYGDIEILTASELGANLFRKIGQPVRFKTAMLNAKEELESGREGMRVPSTVEPAPSDIPSMIARLDQLRKQGVLTEAEFQSKKSELLSKL